MFEIESVEAIPIRIPMRKTMSFATGSLATLEHVVVRIRSRDDVVGTAEAPSRPMVYGESPASIVAAVRDWFAPALIGKQASDHDTRQQMMRRFEQNHTAKGAVDMACYDLVARTLKIPLVTLLGGAREEVDVAHLLGLGSPEAVADEAREIREAYGIGTFKLKAGMDPDRDTALIVGVRKLLGDEIRITVDCNHGYDPQTAARTLPRWEGQGVAWVEEPCQGLDPTSRGWVARSTSLPLMADESAVDVPQVVEEIRRGDCRFISIKLARGGYSRARQIVQLCQAYDIGTVIGSQGDTDLGALTSAHFQAAHTATAKYAGELSFFLEAEGGILTERPEIVGGKLKLPDGPGHGGEIDEAALRKYRID
jgi:L-alanine-DL-glutamate epimerase-like enolase superfamily enzyme